MFTKVLRPVSAWWRKLGLNFVLYLDDGICVCDSVEKGMSCGSLIQCDLVDLGLITSPAKCEWSPSPKLQWLGVEIDFIKRGLKISKSRVQSLLQGVTVILNNNGWATARSVASVVGKLISMSLVLGPLAQLVSRDCLRDVVGQSEWDAPFQVGKWVQEEMVLWLSQLESWNFRPFCASPVVETVVYSDTSDTGGGGGRQW